MPMAVPWSVSPSVPYLTLHGEAGADPLFATFIAFFKCERGGETTHQAVVPNPGEFIESSSTRGATHRMVKVMFDGGVLARQCPAISDVEVIPEHQYDWSLVPTAVRPGESVEQSIDRVSRLWLTTGICPDSAMYEVANSNWLAESHLAASDLHHYILLGHDTYVEVVAKGWRWLPGQETQ